MLQGNKGFSTHKVTTICLDLAMFSLRSPLCGRDGGFGGVCVGKSGQKVLVVAVLEREDKKGIVESVLEKEDRRGRRLLPEQEGRTTAAKGNVRNVTSRI